MAPARCKTCSAAIVWARTERGKAIPIDADPVDIGNIYLRGPNNPEWDGSGTPIAHYARLAPSGGAKRYVTHFVTCPQRQQHRRPSADAEAVALARERIKKSIERGETDQEFQLGRRR